MTHPCNNPNLSPEEFLQRVMVDDTFSMALRVKAAAALTSIQTKAPVPPITIHIKDPYSHEYLTRFPWLKEFAAKGPEQVNTNSQSKSRIRPDSHHPQSGPQAPVYTERTSNPPTFIDYSKPPTPEEIQEIKAAINKLRPDLAHLPVPTPHLCGCGHWMFGPCPLGERCRERSKLN